MQYIIYFHSKLSQKKLYQTASNVLANDTMRQIDQFNEKICKLEIQSKIRNDDSNNIDNNITSSDIILESDNKEESSNIIENNEHKISYESDSAEDNHFTQTFNNLTKSETDKVFTFYDFGKIKNDKTLESIEFEDIMNKLSASRKKFDLLNDKTLEIIKESKSFSIKEFQRTLNTQSSGMIQYIHITFINVLYATIF